MSEKSNKAADRGRPSTACYRLSLFHPTTRTKFGDDNCLKIYDIVIANKSRHRDEIVKILKEDGLIAKTTASIDVHFIRKILSDNKENKRGDSR